MSVEMTVGSTGETMAGTLVDEKAAAMAAYLVLSSVSSKENT